VPKEILIRSVPVVRSFASEFKAFALKGNMIDLAVGVVIGAAFGKVIDSIVKNVIMPLISYVTPSHDFSAWSIGRVKMGLFLNDVISFLIVSLAVFIVIVKVVGWLIRQREKPPEQQPPPVSKDEMLLTEIRDILKAQAERSR
jgi:large conductance mechanosensitive channel